ncbi:MAG: hypothetical protein Q4A41_01485 [Bacillota bacterium]|nr:hypothetical protein [Bacillota bacterium]
MHTVMGQGTAAKIRQMLEHMFDFSENFELGGRTFSLYGKYFRRNSRYFAVKKVEIYAFSNFEHIFLHKAEGHFSLGDFDSVIEHLKEHLDDIVNPNHEHMSSVITLIVECDSLDEELIKKIRKFKYRKSYKFGFWGWADMKVMVIDRSAGKAFENKLAQGDAERLKLV